MAKKKKSRKNGKDENLSETNVDGWIALLIFIILYGGTITYMHFSSVGW